MTSAYESYLAWCEANNRVPMSRARFIAQTECTPKSVTPLRGEQTGEATATAGTRKLPRKRDQERHWESYLAWCETNNKELTWDIYRDWCDAVDRPWMPRASFEVKARRRGSGSPRGGNNRRRVLRELWWDDRLEKMSQGRPDDVQPWPEFYAAMSQAGARTEASAS